MIRSVLVDCGRTAYLANGNSGESLDPHVTVLVLQQATCFEYLVRINVVDGEATRISARRTANGRIGQLETSASRRLPVMLQRKRPLTSDPNETVGNVSYPAPQTIAVVTAFTAGDARVRTQRSPRTMARTARDRLLLRCSRTSFFCFGIDFLATSCAVRGTSRCERARMIASRSRCWRSSRAGNSVRYAATWIHRGASSSSSIVSFFLPAHRMSPSGIPSPRCRSWRSSHRK